MSWFPILSALGKVSEIRKEDGGTLYCRKVVDFRDSVSPSIIWHPNGSLDCPSRIRMGLRDYGLQPFAFSKDFSFYKEGERRSLGLRGRDRPLSRTQHKRLLECLRRMDHSSEVPTLGSANT
jgi:hypothetical protein